MIHLNILFKEQDTIKVSLNCLLIRGTKHHISIVKLFISDPLPC